MHARHTRSTMHVSHDQQALLAGTGKTLSLICSVLQWLKDKQSQPNAGPSADTEGKAIANYSNAHSKLNAMYDFHQRCMNCTPGPDLPDWLVDSPQTGPAVSAATCKVKKKLSCKRAATWSTATQGPAKPVPGVLHPPDEPGSEHLLDAWQSDSDDPKPTGKHRLLCSVP